MDKITLRQEIKKRLGVIDSSQLKRCTYCLKFLPRSDFYKNVASSDGLHYRCKKHTLEKEIQSDVMQYTRYQKGIINRETERKRHLS